MSKLLELCNIIKAKEIFIIPFWFFILQLVLRINVWSGIGTFLKNDFPLSLQILWFTINLYYVLIEKFPHTYIIQIIIVQLCCVILSATISRYLYANTKMNFYKFIAYGLYFIILQIIAFYFLVRGMGFRIWGEI